MVESDWQSQIGGALRVIFSHTLPHIFVAKLREKKGPATKPFQVFFMLPVYNVECGHKPRPYSCVLADTH